MENVYITRSTFKKVIGNIEISEYDYKNLPYYSRLESILSIPERKNLLKYEELLNNLDNINFYVRDLKSYNSDPKKRMIFYKEHPPSYHLDKRCSRLNSGYTNYSIPDEIKNHDIEKYRHFFTENFSLYENKPEVFFARVEIKFHVKISNPKKYQNKNSGIEEVNNYKMESSDLILTRINLLLDEMHAYKKSAIEIEKIIKKVGFGTHKAKYTNKDGNRVLYIEDLDSPVYYWHNYKNNLKSLIESYFTATLNPDFCFKKNVLDECGLSRCKSCSNENNEKNIDFEDEIIF